MGGTMQKSLNWRITNFQETLKKYENDKSQKIKFKKFIILIYNINI